MVARAVDITLRGRDNTRGAFRSVETSFQSLGRRVRAFSQSFGGRALRAGIVGATVAAGALSSAVIRAVQNLADLDTASRNAGVRPEVLQTWRAYGEAVGATSRQVDTTLRRLRRRIGEAIAGGAVARQFDILNVAFADSEGNARSVEDVMEDLSIALQNADDRSTAFAAALRITDIESASLIGGLNVASNGAAEFREEIARAGGVIDDALVQKGAAAATELGKINTVISAQATIIAAEFIPELENLTNVVLPFWIDRIREAREALRDLFDRRSLEEQRDRIEELNDAIVDLTRQRDSDDRRQRQAFLRAGGQANLDALREERRELQVLVADYDRVQEARTRAAATPQSGTIPLNLPPDGDCPADREATAQEGLNQLLEESARIRQRSEDRQREFLLELRNSGLSQFELQERLAALKGEELAANQTLLEQVDAEIQREQELEEFQRAKIGRLLELGFITDEEAERRLRLLDGIREENVLLGEQVPLLSTIGGFFAGFEDSAEGIVRSLGRALLQWAQFRAPEGAGGAGGFINFLGNFFGRSHEGEFGTGPSTREVLRVITADESVLTPRQLEGIYNRGRQAGEDSGNFTLILNGVDYGRDFTNRVRDQGQLINATLRRQRREGNEL